MTKNLGAKETRILLGINEKPTPQQATELNKINNNELQSTSQRIDNANNNIELDSSTGSTGSTAAQVEDLIHIWKTYLDYQYQIY